MGDSNRDFNRRNYNPPGPRPPPYQRNYQQGDPQRWPNEAPAPLQQRGYWRNEPPPWQHNPYHYSQQERYRRYPPRRDEHPYQEENFPQYYPEGGNRPQDREYHPPPPPPREPLPHYNSDASFRDRGGQRAFPQPAEYIDQPPLPANRGGAADMGRKNVRASDGAKTSGKDAAHNTQGVTVDTAAAPSRSKPKRKRSCSDPSNDNEDVIIIPEENADGKEIRDHPGSDSENDVSRTITEVCAHLKLDRGSRLIIEASSRPNISELNSKVPTANSQLTRRTARYGGSQSEPWKPPVKDPNITTMVVLDPILDEAPDFSTRTLAQEFIRCPEKRWLREDSPRLFVGIPYYEKYYIWARMMLLTEEDKKMLDRADVLRGIFGSLFHIPKVWPLIQAFISFWNVDGHTITTSQGEMGYSLLLINDAMGIPISGYVYDEYIPSPFSSDEDKTVRNLHAIYTKLCKWRLSTDLTGKGLVKIQEWLNYFLANKKRDENISETSLPVDHYAPALDPFLKNYGFRVVIPEGESPYAMFSGYRVYYQAQHSRLEYRAAFIATWLCLYCVPMDGGMYLRPEVFAAAVSIAKGTRRAIGIASLAHLYSCLDNIFHSVARGTSSATKCNLALPAHFIMGWFAAYWKAISHPPFCISTFVKNPPFIADCGKAAQISIDFAGAHRIFLATDEQQQCLLSLDFLGRQSSIHFAKQAPVHLNDNRETSTEERSLKIREIDIIISSIVGGVSHRRCQYQNNQVYCPHRFARAHNCDQEVPDFFMDGKLQFANSLEGTLEETTEILTRRLLGYLRPGGHDFELLPASRLPRCSYEYMKWYTSALSFLQQADVFAATISAPRASKVKPTASTPEHPAISVEENPAITPAYKELNKLTELPSAPTAKISETAPTAKKAKNLTGATLAAAPKSKKVKKSSAESTADLEPSSDQVNNNTEGVQHANEVQSKGSESVATTDKIEALAEDSQAAENDMLGSPTEPDTNQEEVMPPVDNNGVVADVDEVHVEKDATVNEDGDPELVVVTASGGSKKEKSGTTPADTKEENPQKALKGWNNAKRISRLTQIKQSVEGAVQEYISEATTIFDHSTLPSGPKSLDQAPGAPLRLPESACGKTTFAFKQIVLGLKNLKALASADNFNQQTFLDTITSTLDGWENFFSSSFTEETKVMIAKLQALKGALDDDPNQEQQDQATVLDFSERTEQVSSMLEKAISLGEQLTASRAQLDRTKVAGDKRQALLDSFENTTTDKIEALEKQLADEKAFLEQVRSLKSNLLDFFKEEKIARDTVDACSSNFKELLVKGDSLSKKLHELQSGGEDSEGDLPGPIRALRTLINAYRFEE